MLFSKISQNFSGILSKRCSENMQSNFIEITVRHGCSPVNLLHIFRTPFSKNTSRWLLLNIYKRNKKTFYEESLHISIFFYVYIFISSISYKEAELFRFLHERALEHLWNLAETAWHLKVVNR